MLLNLRVNDGMIQEHSIEHNVREEMYLLNMDQMMQAFLAESNCGSWS